MTYIRRWLVFLLVFDVFPSPLIRPPFFIFKYMKEPTLVCTLFVYEAAPAMAVDGRA